MVGGPLVTIAPQQTVWQSHIGWARNFLQTWTYTMTATIIAASIGKVRNWHSTQSCVHVAVAVKWPWQLWCTQSLHSVSLVCGASWMCSDDNISIGRNTANKTIADICLLVVFTAAKVRSFFEISQILFGYFLTSSYLCIVILKRVTRKGSLSRD